MLIGSIHVATRRSVTPVSGRALARAGCAFVLLLGCTESPPAEPNLCVPSAKAFVQNAQSIIERRCLKCHGQEPAYGAPFSLLDYDAMVKGAVEQRVVDAMVRALSEFRMPPPGNPQLSHNEFDTLIGWASCGRQHPDWSRGLVASAPVWEAPREPAPNLTRIELTANEYEIAPDTLDHYADFFFENLVDRDMFIRRFDVVVDESRVIHHLNIHYTSDDSYLYAWAPGTGAVEFPDGGLRIRPTDRFRVNIHYNNGAGVENVRDSSGVAIFVAEPVGTEYAMADPNTFAIAVPPHEQKTVVDECVATRDYQILAGMPHMHEIGSSYRHEVERPDGTRDLIVSLTGWSFELQYFYYTPTNVRVGDKLILTCTYDNPHDNMVTGGPKTTDEMCYNFMYVTPPEASAECPPPWAQPTAADAGAADAGAAEGGIGDAGGS